MLQLEPFTCVLSCTATGDVRLKVCAVHASCVRHMLHLIYMLQSVQRSMLACCKKSNQRCIKGGGHM